MDSEEPEKVVRDFFQQNLWERYIIYSSRLDSLQEDRPSFTSTNNIIETIVAELDSPFTDTDSIGDGLADSILGLVLPSIKPMRVKMNSEFTSFNSNSEGYTQPDYSDRTIMPLSKLRLAT